MFLSGCGGAIAGLIAGIASSSSSSTTTAVVQSTTNFPTIASISPTPSVGGGRHDGLVGSVFGFGPSHSGSIPSSSLLPIGKTMNHSEKNRWFSGAIM